MKSSEVAMSLDFNDNGSDETKDGAAASDGDGEDPILYYRGKLVTDPLASSTDPRSAFDQRMSPTTELINESFAVPTEPLTTPPVPPQRPFPPANPGTCFIW